MQVVHTYISRKGNSFLKLEPQPIQMGAEGSDLPSFQSLSPRRRLLLKDLGRMEDEGSNSNFELGFNAISISVYTVAPPAAVAETLL
jgi:hypothetical protein